MLISAIWLLEAEYRFGKKHFTYTDPDPDNMGWYEAVAALTMISGGAVQTAAITMMPYYSLSRAHEAAQWAVRDTMWTRTVRRTRSFYPLNRVLAQPSAWRFAAAKVGSRFIPYVGWALLAYDVYSVGKWVHGKTRWGNPTPGP